MTDHTEPDHTKIDPTPEPTPEPTYPLPDGWVWEYATDACFVDPYTREWARVYVQNGCVVINHSVESAAVDIRCVRVALEKHRGGHHPCAVALSASGGVAVITTGVPDPTLAPHVPTLAIVDGYDGAAASAPLDAVLAVLERAGKL